MQLKINSDKTEYILFGSKQQFNKSAHEPLKAGPDLTELSNKVKYLGGILDNTLNFESHVSLTVQKAMTNFIKVKSICKHITSDACTTLVLILCISHLDHSNSLLYGLPNKTIKRYQIIQNICSKLVLGRPKYSSSTEALKCLHWLPIQQRITYKIGLLTSKYIKKVAPKYLQELITIKKAKTRKYALKQHWSYTGNTINPT